MLSALKEGRKGGWWFGGIGEGRSEFFERRKRRGFSILLLSLHLARLPSISLPLASYTPFIMPY
jgi:hypothetical protein